MKLKLDENLGLRGAETLRSAGHDVATVVDQGLSSSPDRALLELCKAEGRCLVTLDRGFSNPLVFKPDQNAGIVVIRLPPRATARDLEKAIQTLASAMSRRSVHGRLWIAQQGRVREYQGGSQE